MFVCYYCRKKRDSMGYIETKKHPCCAKCNREKKIKDDPNNPYTIAMNKWIEQELKKQLTKGD